FGAESIIGKPLPPEVYYALMANSAAASIGVRFGLMGPVEMVSDSCSSGVNAIELARRAILDGVCDAALAGGADSPITPIAIESFCVPRAYRRPPACTGTCLVPAAPCRRRTAARERASRPFDRDRDGFVIAEGATMVV